jgi:hypothetical protein
MMVQKNLEREWLDVVKQAMEPKVSTEEFTERLKGKK